MITWNSSTKWTTQLIFDSHPHIVMVQKLYKVIIIIQTQLMENSIRQGIWFVFIHGSSNQLEHIIQLTIDSFVTKCCLCTTQWTVKMCWEISHFRRDEELLYPSTMEGAPLDEQAIILVSGIWCSERKHLSIMQIDVLFESINKFSVNSIPSQGWSYSLKYRT